MTHDNRCTNADGSRSGCTCECDGAWHGNGYSMQKMPSKLVRSATSAMAYTAAVHALPAIATVGMIYSTAKIIGTAIEATKDRANNKNYAVGDVQSVIEQAPSVISSINAQMGAPQQNPEQPNSTVDSLNLFYKMAQTAMNSCAIDSLGAFMGFSFQTMLTNSPNN